MKSRYMWLVLLLGLSGTALGQEAGKPEYHYQIFFGGGSYEIDRQQRDELAEFIRTIPKPEEYEVEIHGHTDDIGGREYNQWLSEMRTQAVQQQLMERQIHESAIRIMPFGEGAPTYDNSTWQGKVMNRRVDIVFRRIHM